MPKYQLKKHKKSPHYKGQLSDPKGPAEEINTQKDDKNDNKKVL